MIGALLLAGGTGSRLNSATPKQWLPLGGKPLIRYSYEALASHPGIGEVIVVAADGNFPLMAEPGARRQDSVLNGARKARFDTLLIHDAARPFLTHAVIDRLLEAGKEADGCVPLLPVADTIKQVTTEGMQTLPRAELFAAQTPQLVNKEMLLAGLQQISEVTDDVSVLEQMGGKVASVKGCELLYKATLPRDLLILELLLPRYLEAMRHAAV
ncbi:MAG: 2-C-methyl-D-erythritol 4-phosphate cytidylyltransferase [Chlamydiia bacterium]|nr:2-C-methyl-D-erythritol 4-phosphate cytidylyltransferase [Chlamydiia bacterium]